MRREGVTDLVLLGEQRFYQKIAVAIAQRTGITVTVTDFGYLRPDWITLELDGMSGESRFPRDLKVIRELAKDVEMPDQKALYVDSFERQAVWDIGFHLSNALFNLFSFPHYRSYLLYHPIPAYLGTGLRLILRRRRHFDAEALIDRLQTEGTPYFVLPMQMENDFQLRAYSPYPDMVAPIRQAIRSLAGHGPKGAHLVVKIHPLDPGLRRWPRIIAAEAKAAGMEDRVHFIDGGSLDRLLSTTLGVITVNSTVGIWGLRAGKPVIVLGSAVFNIDGLTFQGGLDRFWTECRAPVQNDVDAFIKALAKTIQIRGVYYNQPGLSAGVANAVERLDRGDAGTTAVRLANTNAAPPRRQAASAAPVTTALRQKP
ncbi:MAG TPA: capsular biosynthesis protein [Stellaceae bacterium]|nr:capsular biosynthesis protein [Stellaceae bacterium]